MTSNSENSDLLKNKEYGSGSEEAEFNVVLHDVRATDLASRNRFRDKLKLVIELDGAKDKSKKQVISGAGEVKWKGPYKFDYKIWSYKHLGDKNILIKLLKSKTEEVGRVSVDLWTVATGPKEHNLPIVDLEGKSIGRLQFILDFEEVSNVAVLFKEIKLKNLKPPSSTTECHPYLKYAYSKNWPVLDDGKKYAVYSTVQYNNKNPEWYDLPEVRFKAPLREILSESIVLHVTHSGSVLNTTLGRCNLLFRTLVDNGKTFKETDLISFKGPLKIDNAEIQGVLVFRFLPRTAQMKSASAIKKALHTESGIHDALPLLPHLPLPNKPLIRSTEAAVDLSQAGGDSPSIQKKRAAAFGPKAVFKDARGGPRSPAQVLHSPELGKAMPKAKELEDKGVKDKPAKFVDDLISLDTPPLQRANARTAFPAALLGSGQEEDPFQASAIPAGSFKPPPALMGSASDPGRPAASSAPNPAAAVNPFLSANTNPAAATFNPFEGQAAPAPVVAAAQPPAQQATLPVGYVDYYGNFPNYQHGNAFTTHAAAPSYGAQPGNFGPTGSFGAQPGNYNTAGVQPGNYNTAGVQPGNFNTTGSFGAGYPAAGVLSPEQIHRQQQLLQQQQAMLQQQMQALNIHQQAIQKQNQPAQNPFGNPF